MEMNRFFEVDRKLQAFRFRDLQTLATILHWTRANEIGMDEVQEYTVFYPVVSQLQSIGYFVNTLDVAHNKRIKEFEKTVPKNLRRMLRKERLTRAKTGAAKP